MGDHGRPSNASRAETQYDDAGRVQAVRNRKSDGTAISIFTYSYDDANNRTGVAEDNGDVVTWSCDETYHLTREQRSGTNAYDLTYPPSEFVKSACIDCCRALAKLYPKMNDLQAQRGCSVGCGWV